MTTKPKLLLGAGSALVLAGAGSAIATAGGGGHATNSVAPAPRVFVSSRPGVRGLGLLPRLGPHGRFFGHDGPRGMHAGPGDDLAAAASYLGTTTSELVTELRSGQTLAQIANGTNGKSANGLIAALVAHEKQELADAVKAGRLTQAQADVLSADLQQRFSDLVNGVRPAFPGHALAPHGLLQAAASYLGLTTADLLTQLESGKTLAQVANTTSGKSADGLIAALVAHAKQALADAVKAGRLTQAAADAMAAQLQKAFTELVSSPRIGHLHGRDGGRPGAPRI